MINFIFAIFRFLFLACIKIFSMLFYGMDYHIVGESKEIDWADTKMVLVLNHTSLFEPIYSYVIPFSFLWRMSRHLVYPIADITSQRPLAGFLFKIMAPKAMAVSRKRDETWDQFVNEVRGKSVVIMLPEGRMKRANGYDKHHQPMSVRGGFFDVLQSMEEGKILFVYSGGLHHIHLPGQKFPKLFKKMKMNAEQVDLVEYKQRFDGSSAKMDMIRDLESRRDTFCPRADSTPWPE